MVNNERSDIRNREGTPHGKTGEGSSSAMKEMVKRAGLQPDTTTTPSPDSEARAGAAPGSPGSA